VATLEATTAAMADFGGQMPDTLARSIVNAPGAKSWPVAGYTYLLLYMDQQDCAKAQRLVSFIKWGLTDGTRFATELDYAPLADNVKAKVLERVSKVTCQGKPMGGK
jgi:phosphate transport system substrate-binding protein